MFFYCLKHSSPCLGIAGQTSFLKKKGATESKGSRFRSSADYPNNLRRLETSPRFTVVSELHFLRSKRLKEKRDRRGRALLTHLLTYLLTQLLTRLVTRLLTHLLTIYLPSSLLSPLSSPISPGSSSFLLSISDIHIRLYNVL